MPHSDPPPVVVWFRRDLRLADNEALKAAASSGRALVPVFIWAPEDEAPWQPGGASRSWLRRSLESLGSDLEQAGSRLIVRTGTSSRDALDELVAETGATAVHWNRHYEPGLVARDAAIERALTAAGIKVSTSPGSLLHEPSAVANQAGKPFLVFTPFWRHLRSLGEPPDPLPVPSALRSPSAWPRSVTIDDLLDQHAPDGDWEPGEPGAWRALERFIEGPIERYETDRDLPGARGTSRLSPHLHFGEITPRQVWHTVRRSARGEGAPAHEKFLSEVGWREFAHHLLHHFPFTTERPLRPEFAAFPWQVDAEGLEAWRQGRTGYPLVDAGMRELSATGWMHNRVRMVTASFLVKHLRIDWLEGARWFWENLLDANLANNTFGWQWSAGSGADAAPYFRIFNPTLQGEKFDPDGAYVRRWVPELASLPPERIHRPGDLALGAGYPGPIVDHATARADALAAFAKVRSNNRSGEATPPPTQ